MRHRAAVKAVAFSPDGKSVLTATYDGTARLWDPATGQPIGTPLPNQSAVLAWTFSPDGKVILTGSLDGTARLFDAATGQPVGAPMRHQSSVGTVAFNHNGSTVLTTTGRMARLWDAATGRPIGSPMPHQGAIQVAAFSPDGRLVLTGSADSTARLWDAATGQPIVRPFQHQGEVWAVAFSPDSRTFLTGCDATTARRWDVATARPIGPPFSHKDGVYAVAFSPDGRTVLTGGADKTARLWDASILADDLERIGLWIEVITGLGLDDEGSVHILDHAAWRQRRERLDQLGGTPLTAPGRLRDPLLFGSDPTARARAWVARQRWDEAEAAFDEAVRARPLAGSVWAERGRFFLARSRWEEAASDFTRSLLLGDRDPQDSATIAASERVVRSITARRPDAAAMLWDARGRDLGVFQGQLPEAARAYRNAVQTYAALAAAQPGVLAHREGLAIARYNLACTLASDSSVVRADERRDPVARTRQADELAAEAIDLLRQVRATGFFDRPEYPQYRSSGRIYTDLARLRSLPGFATPLMDLDFPDQPFAR
jgi:tetratricopeptide (TPR) repeat protein